MKLPKILAYIFAVIALIFEGFFGIIPFVSFVLQIILLAFWVFFLIWILRRGKAGKWKDIIPQYVLTMTATIGFFITLMLAFVQYQYMSPGVVSDITLSHSGQQIVFVEMSHIASPEFYQSKKETIQSLSASGYTILVEWVRPGTPANQAIFDTTIWFSFTPTLYSTLADLIWLQSQDNQSLFAGISTGSLVSVDLSIDEIVSYLGTGSQNLASTWSLVDIETEIRSTMDAISPRERSWIGWVGRWLLSWSLRRSGDLAGMLTTGSQGQLFTTIIDRRNDAIVRYIQEHPTQRIAIVYWALHFNGVYEALQRIDPKWSVIRIENSKPYSIR